MRENIRLIAAPLLCLSLMGGEVFAAKFEAASGLSALGTGGTLPDPDLEVKGFSVFGSTDVLTYISTAPGNAVFNGAVQVSSDVYVVGLSTFSGHAVFTSSITSSYVRGLAAPLTADAAANKAYVDAMPDVCARGSATTSDIAQGKAADINCDNVAEGGALAAQSLDASTDEVKTGIYAATWLSAVDADLAPANIRAGYTMFGHDGSFTSDSDATAGDMLAPKTAYVNGVKLTGTIPVRTLDPANATMSEGYYAATTLAAVDPDLSAGNIKSGVTIFGYAGSLTAPPAPDVGGTWLLVPGNSSLGTRDFYVQKYEAKNVASVPTSEAAGTPWVGITQTEAKMRCEALGPGYHLITMTEALTISRNIENNAWNWTGGSVGSGGLWRGHTDSAPNNSLAADISGDPDDDPYVGTGDTAPSIEKRVHQLSTGQYLWDWSGNGYEWVGMTCNGGSGTGYWYNNAAWIEWSDANLTDYEKPRAGPAGAYTSTQNAGRYYGCTAVGNVVLRGGAWSFSAYAGVFAFDAATAPSYSSAATGFRCAR